MLPDLAPDDIENRNLVLEPLTALQYSGSELGSDVANLVAVPCAGEAVRGVHSPPGPRLEGTGWVTILEPSGKAGLPTGPSRYSCRAPYASVVRVRTAPRCSRRCCPRSREQARCSGR